MKKKNVILLSLLPIALIGILFSITAGNDTIFGLRVLANDNTTWYHYTATHASSSYGSREYWTDCKGTTVLDQPTSGTIVENGAADGNAIHQYNNSDPRLINRFGSDLRLHGYQVGENAITVDGIFNEAEYSGVTANKVEDGDRHTPSENAPEKATADLYIAYDSTYLYMFFDVKDSTPCIRDFSQVKGDWTESNDALEIRIDLLHDTSISGADWNGSWGGDYRGGTMCEAFFKVAAGYDPTDSSKAVCYNRQWGDGVGCEFVFDYWWSNGCRTDGTTSIVSKTNSEGYTVEMRINFVRGEIPADIRPINNTEIGLGVKLYNKTSDNRQNITVFEGYNDAMGDTPRNCTTVTLHPKTEN